MSMAVKKSPLSRVKDEFGGKDKLVDKIVGVLDSGDESKDDLRKRLLGVANTQADSSARRRHQDQAGGGHEKLAASRPRSWVAPRTRTTSPSWGRSRTDGWWTC